MLRLLLVATLLVPAIASAQQQNDPATQVTELARHITEMRELLDSRDTATRDAAVETALRDPSPAVRGMAIYYALRRYSDLPLEFAIPAGSPIPRQGLPSLVLGNAKWSQDGRSLAAYGRSACAGATIKGQIIGDRLRLQFQQICFPADLVGTAPSTPGSAARRLPYSGCETELSPTPAHDSLAGALRCPALPLTLPLSLPLG